MLSCVIGLLVHVLINIQLDIKCVENGKLKEVILNYNLYPLRWNICEKSIKVKIIKGYVIYS